ncbi:glycoside hydrolase family 16 protein [Solibacillus sp. FSL H8-0538]|uniref:glycoside hydrolase family 16 protein n=1 Tax=Solibacillus sp. FSL H8-0538 TaxID=2921400 RepID=UPI0040469DF7
MAPSRCENKTLLEIDVFEVVGNDPSKIYVVNHTESSGKLGSYSKTYSLPSFLDFHNYVIECNKHELRWYVDDELVFTSK